LKEKREKKTKKKNTGNNLSTKTKHVAFRERGYQEESNISVVFLEPEDDVTWAAAFQLMKSKSIQSRDACIDLYENTSH
jgi:hypothetical protein